MSDLTQFLLNRLAEDEAYALTIDEHIARHDPARVLAECEAKRRIMSYGPTLRRAAGSHERALIEYHRWTEMVEALALPYADHADYRQEWKL